MTQPAVTHAGGAPVATRAEAAIAVHALTKRYGRTVAVDGLTFEVPRGGVVGFVGPNGAGKTTTIRVLMGLIRPTAGHAFVLGQPVSHPETYLPRVGALIESPAFYPALSGRRNLHALAILGRHDRARVDEVLSLVGLAERGDDAYGQYSLGMKQRLGIAAALLPDPELLILDEPTNGLDPAGIREMRTLLRAIGDSGRTVFVSSHLLAEIQRMCDRLLVLRRGRLVFTGTVDELLVHRVGIVAVPADPGQRQALIAMCRTAGYDATELPGAVLAHAPSEWAPAFNELAMREGIVLRELRLQSGDLEEMVLAMTGVGGP